MYEKIIIYAYIIYYVVILYALYLTVHYYENQRILEHEFTCTNTYVISSELIHNSNAPLQAICTEGTLFWKNFVSATNTNTDHDVQQILKDIIYSPTRKSPRRLQEKFTKSVCISRLETSDSCLPFSIMPQVLKLIQLTWRRVHGCHVQLYYGTILHITIYIP